MLTFSPSNSGGLFTWPSVLGYESDNKAKKAVEKCHDEWGKKEHADGCNIGVALYVFSRMLGDARKPSREWCEVVCDRHPDSVSRFSQASCKQGCYEAYRAE